MSELGLEQGQPEPQPTPQGSDAPRRGRPPNSAKPAQASDDKFDTITYMPIMGDPIEVVWHGITFPANIAVKVPRSHTYKVPTKVRSPMKDDTGEQLYEEDAEGNPILDAKGRKKMRYHDGMLMPDGTLQTRMVETDVPMVDMAKGNPRFSVNGAPPAYSDKKGIARTPETADEYRSYALAWIAGANNKLNMTQRWRNEAALRADVGLSKEAEAILLQFFDARLLQAEA